MQVEFIQTPDRVQILNDGAVFFNDTYDHYSNGIVRLLGVPEVELEKFMKLAASRLRFLDNPEYKTWIKILRECWNSIFPETINPVATQKNSSDNSIAVFTPNQMLRFAPSSKVGVVYDRELDYGRLVDAITFEPINATTVYEESYFTGELDRVGYGNMDLQEWRIEKADRLANRVLNTPGVESVKDLRVLDIGSGYGQFVHSLHKLEVLNAFGLDISKHAAKRAKDEFNVQTFVGELQHLIEKVKTPFNVATMWDYIEHPTDPAIELKALHELLSPGGFLFIKTPNINCPEFSIFQNYFHSLKPEHIHYFSVNSLRRLLELSGFSIQICETSSHIFQGFQDGFLTKEAVRTGNGSDIYIVARRN